MSAGIVYHNDIRQIQALQRQVKKDRKGASFICMQELLGEVDGVTEKHPINDYQGEEVRCLCNRLLFMVKGSDIEIKCVKCKRIIIISTKGITNVTFK